MPIAIEATDLVRRFGEVEAVRGVSLEIEEGEIYGFLGPNGAGKSTTVRILTTLLEPTSGSGSVLGHDVVREAMTVRRLIGVALQEAGLDPKQTGRELLTLQARLYGLRGKLLAQQVREVTELVGLTEAMDRRIQGYSGGMKRRLDLASALLHRPRVLFLDEPTTGLDPTSRSLIWDRVRQLRRQFGATILLTTQYLEEADQLADRIAVIDKGRVVAEGTAAELKRKVGTERLKLTFATAGEAAQVHLIVGGVLIDDTVSVGIDQPAQVRRVLNQIADAGFETTGIELSEPTLDDVFHTLTGTAGEK